MSYSSVLKTQLEMFSKCTGAQFKKCLDSEQKFLLLCFFENGIKFCVFKFHTIFCLCVLNFVNFLKSRKSQNLILGKISKIKVHHF